MRLHGNDERMRGCFSMLVAFALIAEASGARSDDDLGSHQTTPTANGEERAVRDLVSRYVDARERRTRCVLVFVICRIRVL